MQSFLQRISEEIIGKHPESLDKVSIILPSRRATVFLLNHLKNQIKKNSWLPQIYSLEDFIISLGDYTILDQIDLIFELYDTHCEIEGKNADSLEDFMGWGGILLQDFNEIDRYLIDPNKLYNYLAEAKEIESWDLETANTTEFQKKYLHFWQSLGKYYNLYTNKLLKENKVYQGLAFRKIAEKLYNKELNIEEGNYFYFAGFNALTKAEQSIIDELVIQNGAKLLWDADEYYLNDDNQEAGAFLRKHKQKQHQFNWVFDNLKNDIKEINIYGISGNVAQAKLIGNLLATKSKKEDIKNTAIVLADESLLLPVLESIPKEIQQMNVTMGYPLSNSIFYHFFVSIISLHFKKTKGNFKDGFYFKDVLALVDQLVFQLMGKTIIDEAKKIEQNIKDNRRIYVEANTLKKLEEAVGILFINLEEDTPSTLIVAMQEICKKIKASKTAYEALNDIEKEFLFSFYKVLNRISDINIKQNRALSYETLLQLFKQILAVESIDFVGEPLEGLQLMGVLESRTLDFEHIILSSLNEGVLPVGKTQNSFIPYDIKREFGLPSYREKDSIFAYHFYRLLQRAKKVDLIYNSRIDPVNGGERSRFIEQIINELPKANPNIKLNHHTISPKVPIGKEEEFSIKKTDEHLEAIKAHLARGISPSALNNFIMCPLNYYYRYILGMKEEELIEEQVASNSFGSIVHHTLEMLYKPYVGQLLDLKSLQEIKKRLNDQIVKSYIKEIKINPNKGHHKLAFEVAKRIATDFIASEERAIREGNEIHLIDLERRIQCDISLTTNEGENIPIKFNGHIDRVDRFNGTLRIIDYKTGKVDKKKVSYKDLEILLRPDKAYARQLLLYQLAYEMSEKETAQAGIIPLTNLSSGFISLNNKENMHEDAMYLLTEVISEMLNQEAVFTHSPESTYCNFC